MGYGWIADDQGLENYTLLEKMGDGAFSNVFKAMDNRAGRKVAVKVVRKYELNTTQVSSDHGRPAFSPLSVAAPLTWVERQPPPEPQFQEEAACH